MGDTVNRLATAAMALLVACRSSPAAAPPQAGPGCRDVARRAENLISKVPAATRDEATRFFAEVIDLCQAPGLAQRARTCLATAADLTVARNCPSLPETAPPSAREPAQAPSCAAIVEHAMRVLDQEPDAPVSAADRAEEQQIFQRDCAAASARGRRCAAVALSLDAIDECLALRDDRDGP